MGGSIDARYWYALVVPDKNRDKILKRFIMKNYPRMFQYIAMHINNKECPVCHRRFKTRYALYKHLHHRASCRETINKLISLIRRHVPENEVLKYMNQIYVIAG